MDICYETIKLFLDILRKNHNDSVLWNKIIKLEIIPFFILYNLDNPPSESLHYRH